MNIQSAEVVRVDIPATYKHLSIVSACIAEIIERAEDVDERKELIYTLQLAVHEACANIVEHAYASQPEGRIAVTLTLCARPRQLCVDLQDTGRPFDLFAVPDPDLSQPQVSGYGLFLIHNLVDEVTYTPGSTYNCWRLIKKF